MYKYINIGEGEQTATYDSAQTNLGAGRRSGLLMGALGCDEMRALLPPLERTDEPPVHPPLQCTVHANLHYNLHISHYFLPAPYAALYLHNVRSDGPLHIIVQ